MCAILAVPPPAHLHDEELDQLADGLEEVLLAVQEGRTSGVGRRWSALRPLLTRLVDSAIASVPEAARQLVPAYLEISAQVGRRLDAAAEEQLVVSLEAVAEALLAYREGRPVGEERTPVELITWIAATLDAPQSEVAWLLGVSLRTLQRWLRGEVGVGAAEQSRIRMLARTVNELRFAFTPRGAVAWLLRPTAYLDGATPLDLLRGEAEGGEARLQALLAGVRYA